MHFRFYYDVVCPYAYLASLCVDALVNASMQPLSGVLCRSEASTVIMKPKMSRSNLDPSKVLLGAQDLLREARSHGAPFEHNPLHPTVCHRHAAVVAAEASKESPSAKPCTMPIVKNLDINDPATLEPIAAAHGLRLTTPRANTSKMNCASERQRRPSGAFLDADF